MDLSLTREDDEFRQEVRLFIRDNLPAEIADRTRRMYHIERDDALEWHRIVHRKGWSAPAWPVEHGGTGWTALQRYIFEEESSLADAPPNLFAGSGISMVGPILYTFGTDEQKQRYLPRILSGEDFWCQGFSEPGAGSDLASLRTRAVRDGDGYLINGQKIWTSLAHHATMIFCLVRTDPDVKPQSGISFFIFPLDTPGITINPIITIDRGHTLNEVFFDNVRVTAANLVGEEGKGWTYAKFLLGHERLAIAEIGRSKRRLQILREMAKRIHVGSVAVADDPAFQHRIAAIDIDLIVLEQLALKMTWESDNGIDDMTSACIVKLRGSFVVQAITELMTEVTGYMGLGYELLPDKSVYSPSLPDIAQGTTEDFLYSRAITIYGGSTEVQYNIIAKSEYRRA